MAVTSLDGRAFGRFVAAGTYFLRKYHGVLNDLNVFPVPDGDTGSNMYLTARAALRDVRAAGDAPLSAVAAAAARGSLLGARGNSGVILSQMLRGFAHAVRYREAVDTFQLAVALKDAVATARSALTQPVEGTIVTVAQVAADEAYRLAMKEPDFYRLATGIVRAANDALERTPDQLPALKEAGVVDAGGAGLCYFLEGALSFLPETTVRATAFPRRPVRAQVFARRQQVGENRFCTEFVLENATIEAHPLRDVLAAHGDSLIVAGNAPTIKVHVHAAYPDDVQALAAKYGTLTRVKVDDMARQHRLLVVDAPAAPFGVAAVVPGAGFERIARELGADATIALPRAARPSVEELLVGVNAVLAERVYLLANDPNVALAAGELAALTDKTVVLVPTRDIVRGLAVQLALAGRPEPPSDAAVAAAMDGVRSASVFFAGKDAAVGGVAVRAGHPVASIDGQLLTATSIEATLREAVAAMGGNDGGLVTLYYGGKQKERDAQRYAADLASSFAGVSVEYYYGGQSGVEYWVSVEAL